MHVQIPFGNEGLIILMLFIKKKKKHGLQCGYNLVPIQNLNRLGLGSYTGRKGKVQNKKHYIYFVKLMTKPFLPRLQFFKEHLGQ
jgi:hypothetical protein